MQGPQYSLPRKSVANFDRSDTAARLVARLSGIIDDLGERGKSGHLRDVASRETSGEV
jgi:hypothetical protein